MRRPYRRLAIEVARRLAGLDTVELWLQYLALGGTAGAGEVIAFLEGSGPLGERDCELLEAAVADGPEHVRLGSPGEQS